jgi:hypothetical protein
LSPVDEQHNQLTIPMRGPSAKRCENYKEKKDGHVW